MNKKFLIAFIIAIVLVVASYLYWQATKGPVLSEDEKALNSAKDAAQIITDSATQGVLPSLDVQSENPLSDAPDVNPASKANPFDEIKTNPFK